MNDLPLGRSVAEALRVLDALQFIEKHGEVCPANWQQGEEAMKPTAAGWRSSWANTPPESRWPSLTGSIESIALASWQVWCENRTYLLAGFVVAGGALDLDFGRLDRAGPGPPRTAAGVQGVVAGRAAAAVLLRRDPRGGLDAAARGQPGRP